MKSEGVRSFEYNLRPEEEYSEEEWDFELYGSHTYTYNNDPISSQLIDLLKLETTLAGEDILHREKTPDQEEIIRNPLRIPIGPGAKKNGRPPVRPDGQVVTAPPAARKAFGSRGWRQPSRSMADSISAFDGFT